MVVEPVTQTRTEVTIPSVLPQDRRPVLLDALEGRHPRQIAGWIVVMAAVTTAHLGLFWYLTHDRASDSPPFIEAPAAVMIDMSAEVQQAFSATDQAVGKPMEEAAQEPPPPDIPTPDLTPPVEDSPTEAVAPLPPKPPEKPKVEKKPEKKQPPKPKKPPTKVATKAAPRSAGGPRSDQHAERTTAASAGAASAESVADWRSQVAAALNRNKRYPSGADAFGIPTLRMAIGRSGAVTGVSVVASSGSSELDQAALETVRRSSPFPPPPDGTSSLTFRMNFHRR